VGGGPFTVDGKHYPYKIVLSTEDPKVTWSMSKGANLDAEISQAVGSIKAKMKTDSIYEIGIRKIGTLEIDANLYDSAAFDTYVTSLYTFKNDDITLQGFKKFSQGYGVATSGAIYEISLTEFKEENIETAVNATGLVKADGKIYSKVGGVVRVNLVRLFYSEATANLAQLQKVHEVINKLHVTKEELIKGLQNLDSKDTSEQIKSATNAIKTSM
jgi:chaperonin cofactor prefoldin